ncbi:hypothetical protein [Streptomyces rapamycinicus]|uniref:Uncharacterized protein n=2 Tax=Streptomyces rapamycinicus TaxID=1226757 RepID=A0A0A0ND26_STRRN|nr:hypothetical protein [Streptomyces rapamycinicus]AGP57367.1 hypothetical protein M271_29605 [Streptomyces rapamycinicus NRRL 5491]MBB4785016.1 putative membrane protein [Streptomyces rapamycinicus]RLV79507.1 hypothetical protein D3C57_114020 [Streptomyces rapamycinicus NRRL 5491]UTO65250.1 hypothetical protein LJB45_24960 [Streptomyces rapamycinicus]UTP33206.1 hypothetical protein LIV37_30090 [Streptomyces rapamycinicus NRRL 5491]
MQPPDPHHTIPGHIAPHIPADVYQRAQASGQPVVIVVNDTNPTGFPWQRVLIPFAIAGAVVAGGWGLAAALCWLMDVATHTATAIAGATAGPLGVGGITLKLAQSKK